VRNNQDINFAELLRDTFMASILENSSKSVGVSLIHAIVLAFANRATLMANRNQSIIIFY